MVTEQRVAPLKAVSIPRLKLTADVVAVKLNCVIQVELPDSGRPLLG